MKPLLAFLAALLLPLSAAALEGKWTPQQVLQLDPAWLKKEGLELPPSRLWDPQRGTGLLAGTINVGGCSAGFISAEGLFITNHHCLFGVLQEHATPENDMIANGYVARTRAEELRSRSLRATLPRRFVDVTKEVLAAVPPGADDAERYRAIERKQNELVAACEQQPGMRCKVAAHDGGVQYVLQEMREIADVRLVYAPPRAVGEYGGEIDNWMWPRHGGDFAVGRLYVDDRPYRPEFFFPIATRGVQPDDFVMVLGYPGITWRSLTAAEMSERVLFFEHRREIFGEWIRLLESTTRGDQAGAIAVADTLKTLANRFKNAEGQLAGFRRGAILDRQRTRDEAVLRWARSQPAHAGAVAAHEELARMAETQKRTETHDFLLDQVRITSASLSPLGPKALVFAIAVARSAVERAKPDEERDSAYMQRFIGRVRERMEREEKNFFPPADKAVFADWLARTRNLPADQRIAALEGLPPVDELYAQSKLLDLAERLRMFDESVEQLHARRDPLVELGFALDREIRTTTARRQAWEGMILRLRPQWRRAVIAHAGTPVAPDANGTLRVSFAHVQGYTPRDGVFYVPRTTLAGVVEKATGEEPFNAPPKILEAARAKRYGRWKDPRLKDVPVDFLSDADTTGGNSGSPVINGRGELVGVNFDRVWENVANDFGYMPEVNRNISVDVRYLLWILDQVEHAEGLLGELGVK